MCWEPTDYEEPTPGILADYGKKVGFFFAFLIAAAFIFLLHIRVLTQ